MKSKFLKRYLLIVAVTAFTASSAHAISAKHRQALEWSGCNMVTESNGTCDIHKSKAQNRNASKGVPDRDIIYDVLPGADIADAAEVLLQHGWKPNNGWWHKQGHKLFLNVDANKKVASAILR